MTEEEWLTCADLGPMLQCIGAGSGPRKLRLFALACCSRIDHLITDPRSRAALAFANRHVEVAVNQQKGRSAIEKAGRKAWTEAYAKMFTVPESAKAACLVASCAADTAVATMNTDPTLAARYASSFASFAVGWGLMHAAGRSPSERLPPEVTAGEREQQARLLRNIFGNPFRPVSTDPGWLTSTVVALARGIYDDRAFDRLPILADALQDAGCEHPDVLDHCRGSGPHVRGCWVVDLLLGKQ
jgi:hypothetical protein